MINEFNYNIILFLQKINIFMHNKIENLRNKHVCVYWLSWWGRIKIQDVISIFVTIFPGKQLWYEIAPGEKWNTIISEDSF